jgi:hypothetical protein
MMEITIGHTAVTQVEYQFDEWDVERALVELIKREHSERLLASADWQHEWWPNDDGRLVFVVTQKFAEPGEDVMAETRTPVCTECGDVMARERVGFDGCWIRAWICMCSAEEKPEEPTGGTDDGELM